MIEKYFIGMISGMTATICVQPIDYIKVYIQLHPTQSRFATLNNIYQSIINKNIWIIYSGLPIALFRQSIYGTIRLGMYQDLKDTYQINSLLAATISATVATIINNPIDYWLVNRQTNHNFSIIHHLKKDGFLSLFTTGLKFNILRAITINTGFGMMPHIKNKINESISFNNQYISKVIAIVLSSILSTYISLPFDVMRTLSHKNIPINSSNLTFSILYKSYPAFAFRIIPHSMISMSCLEIYTELYNQYHKNEHIKGTY